jgi:hypothetical protein
MRTPLKRSFILGGTLVAALTIGGFATAGATSGATSGEAGPAASVTTTDENGPVVETEKGVVLEGLGQAGRREIHVTAYENSIHGNFLTIAIGEQLVGSKQTTKAFVVDGQLRAQLRLDGDPAVLKGTVTEAGQKTQIRDSILDAGQRIVTKGTNTPLAVDATLTFRGRTYAVAFDTAFAYDLTVQKVTLYGR